MKAAQQLFVSEIFKSIQGEGPKIGIPSIFLRLGICNLHCDWCDTPYTWKAGVRDYELWDFKEVAKKMVDLCKNTAIKNLVITGGEPLLQQEKLAQLLMMPIFENFEIEFETNGSMAPLPSLKKMAEERKFSFNISPKLADSGNKTYKVHIYPRSVLKFVYVNKKSEKLIEDFLKNNEEAKGVPVYVMPEGVTADALQKKTKMVLDFCLKKAFIFTPRLHIYLFGSKRGT